MADDTTSTTPGDAPDVLKTGADGSLPNLSAPGGLNILGHRRAWVWMQDTPDGGGGRFDVRADRVEVWRRKGATVVPDYPIYFGPAGRTAKPATTLAGAPATERVEDQRLNQPTGEPVEGQRLGQPPAESDQAGDETAATDTTTATRTKGGRTR